MKLDDFLNHDKEVSIDKEAAKRIAKRIAEKKPAPTVKSLRKKLAEVLLHPRSGEHAAEVVLFWTDYRCACGRHYETPTYGNTLTRYELLQRGKPVASVYQPFCGDAHAHLPRRIDTTTVRIPHCQRCLLETQLEEDYSS